MATAFVAGATGYTGREVVRVLCEEGVTAFAHVRPDSPRLSHWRRRFETLGAEVDTTAWDPGRIAQRLAQLSPTHVFALLGTTRRRASAEGMSAAAGYEAVDYGMTMMLVDGAAAVDPPPRLVYLSMAGLRDGARGAYMQARVRVERALREGAVPYTIARPSFITGSGRDEFRAGERLGAAVSDGLLAVVGVLGGGAVRDRYRSMNAADLAKGLVRVALDPAFENRIAQAEDLR